MKKNLSLLLFVLLPLLTVGQDNLVFTIKGNTGVVHSFPSRLVIEQDGFPTIRHRGKYKAESLILPIYWDYSFQFTKNGKSFGIRNTHHKIILRNKTDEIQDFQITHGFNMVDFFYSWKWKDFWLLAGAGFTIAHPESKIRGQSYSIPRGDGVLNSQYMITWPNVEGSISRRFYFGDHFFLCAEGRISLSYYNVPVYEGRARGYNVAAHLVTGFGFDIGGTSR